MHSFTVISQLLLHIVGAQRFIDASIFPLYSSNLLFNFLISMNYLSSSSYYEEQLSIGILLIF